MSDFPKLVKGDTIGVLIKNVVEGLCEGSESVCAYGTVEDGTADFIMLKNASCRVLATGRIKELWIRKDSIIAIDKRDPADPRNKI